MNLRLAFILVLFFCGIIGVEAQQKKITLYGYVEDAETGEKLPGASVLILNTKSGTTTNNYGFFTITIPAGNIQLIISSIGYKAYEENLSLNTDQKINLKLIPNNNLDEVVITAQKSPAIQQQTQMSRVNVPITMVKSMPRFLGETDVLKTIQLLPGVSQGSEGNSNILVRGGGPEQNLILLDGTLIYNPSHFLGIFSTFNGDAIKNVELYKGGFPARFGGRLSSVVDLVMKDGNMKKINGDASIGLLASNLTLEGPIKKDKTSFLVSGRRTYLDLIAEPLAKKTSEGELKNLGVYFYDLNAKLHHIISDKDRIFASFFDGQDVFNVKNEYQTSKYLEGNTAKINWGNTIGTLRWNHVFNNRLFANTLINYTRYKFFSDFIFEQKDTLRYNLVRAKYSSSIEDLGARIDFDYRPSPEHNIKTGATATFHTFRPGALTFKAGDAGNPGINMSFTNQVQHSPELGLYAEDDWLISNKLKLNAGVHASAFRSKTKWYGSVQPRLGLRYLLPADIAFKASYAQMVQYIHFLTNNSNTLPTDLWVPSTDRVKPMRSQQVAIGFAKTIMNGKVEASIESYYKKMDGVIEYLDGSSYINSSVDEWDTKVEAGNATAIGLELFLQKKVGKTTGWIGYTLSKSDRVFPTINFGKKFFYKYDRLHDFEIVVIHKLRKNIELSGSWQFQTGSPYTLPVAQYESISGYSPKSNNNSTGVVDYIKGRNEFRLLNYHRLDASITFIRQRKKYERSWNISVYNAYNRQNPFYYYLGQSDEDTNSNSQRVLKGITLLPLVPGISYRIKF
ncbi:MAG TPA: TonB-dependent receptor [Niabella sp.]|nr:TonB-dependent receptor [Chitinophagaceae bacterium]HRO83234.1 TonB-dependent receptor [Niabella sp.]